MSHELKRPRQPRPSEQKRKSEDLARHRSVNEQHHHRARKSFDAIAGRAAEPAVPHRAKSHRRSTSKTKHREPSIGEQFANASYIPSASAELLDELQMTLEASPKKGKVQVPSRSPLRLAATAPPAQRLPVFKPLAAVGEHARRKSFDDREPRAPALHQMWAEANQAKSNEAGAHQREHQHEHQPRPRAPQGRASFDDHLRAPRMPVPDLFRAPTSTPASFFSADTDTAQSSTLASESCSYASTGTDADADAAPDFAADRQRYLRQRRSVGGNRASNPFWRQGAGKERLGPSAYGLSVSMRRRGGRARARDLEWEQDLQENRGPARDEGEGEARDFALGRRRSRRDAGAGADAGAGTGVGLGDDGAGAGAGKVDKAAERRAKAGVLRWRDSAGEYAGRRTLF